MTGEGGVWGKVRPLQALVVGVSAESPPPPLHHPPLQLRPTMAWAPLAAQLALQPVLPSMILDGCWGSHRQLSPSSIHAWQRTGHRNRRGMGGRDGWCGWVGWLSCHHHQRMDRHSRGQLAWPSCLGGPHQALHLAPC